MKLKLKITAFLPAVLLFNIQTLKAQTAGTWNATTTPTTTLNSVGVGTHSPLGMQEIRYCYDSIFGLTITNYDCGNAKNVGSLDFLNPTFDGVLEDAGGEQTIGGSTAFTIPINYSLTGYNSSLAKPMIWARVENSSIIPKSSGPYTSRFLVTPYGRSGFNVENPRATLDIKSLASYDIPALIVGRQALGTSNRTQHFQYVPLLTENGYNQITKKNDQGFFLYRWQRD
jgi:hypothetical protein